MILIDNGELMADEKMLTNVVELAEEDVVFHLFFLANDENKSVKIEEVKKLILKMSRNISCKENLFSLLQNAFRN